VGIELELNSGRQSVAQSHAAHFTRTSQIIGDDHDHL